MGISGFSVTQILREISFIESEGSENTILAIFGPLNFVIDAKNTQTS